MTAFQHPLLDSSDEVVEGYRIATAVELGTMRHAAGQHPELVERWQRLLTLHRQAMLGSTTFPGDLDDEDGRKAFALRLMLLGLSGGTSKLVLDAALYGHYSGSFGLTRHLTESWLQAAYVGIQPDAARAWFRQSADAVKDQKELYERKVETAVRELKKHFKETFPSELYMVERTDDVRTAMHKGAHPSGYLLHQLTSGEDNRFIYGANYHRDLALIALTCGIWATIVVTIEAHRLIPQSVEWQEAWETIRGEHETIIPDFSSAPYDTDSL